MHTMAQRNHSSLKEIHMLFVREKVAKLGGKFLGGQVTNIEIQSSANVHVKQNKQGKITKMQASGYEQAKVIINITLESTKNNSANRQLKIIQSLFKANKQKNARKMKIVNTQCAACGVTQVYFKSVTCTKVISESSIIATLELWAPKTAGVKVKKKSSKKKTAKKKSSKSKKSTSKSPAKDKKPLSTAKKNASKVTK